MDIDRLEAAIMTAPAWAKVGLTMPSERMRQRATRELAASILEGIDRAPQYEDRDQLKLSL